METTTIPMERVFFLAYFDICLDTVVLLITCHIINLSIEAYLFVCLHRCSQNVKGVPEITYCVEQNTF